MKQATQPSWLPDWIRIAADGRLSWYEGGAKGVGRRRQKRCGDVATATTKARELMQRADRAAGLSTSPNATWADLCQAWVDAHDGQMAEGTFRRRIAAINAWILPNAGTLPVVDTQLSTLLRVADALTRARTSRSNFETVTQTMTVIANWARERNWLPADPFGSDGDRKQALKRLRRQLKDPTRRVATEDDNERGITFDKIPLWDDVEALAAAVAEVVNRLTTESEVGELYACAVRVAAGTGLRMCELLALHVDRVDMATGIITVDRQLDRYKPWNGTGEMPTTAPKHGKLRRVAVWDKVRPDLQRLIDAAGEDGVLLPPFNGQRWWANVWGRTLLKARTEIGWGWPPHWLRHHYGSVSFAPREAGGYGLSAVEVQQSLGHRSLTTTLETYIQPTRATTGWVQ